MNLQHSKCVAKFVFLSLPEEQQSPKLHQYVIFLYKYIICKMSDIITIAYLCLEIYLHADKTYRQAKQNSGYMHNINMCDLETRGANNDTSQSAGRTHNHFKHSQKKIHHLEKCKGENTIT